MKFGYILPNYGDKISPKELLDIAGVCEEVGFDSVWATDHIIMPQELKEPYGQVLEPLTTLAYIASRNEKIKVGTSCIVLAQRNPILVAKQAAALDVLSGGRLILGLGAGWAEKEFEYLNADFENRGAVFDESIRLMRSLWTEDVVDFKGEFFEVGGALFLPKPMRRHVPIWIGGNGPISVRRAAKLGDGWHPVGIDVEEFIRGVGMIRDSGRDVAVSVRMTTDVRKKREPTVAPNGQKRIAVSGTAVEIRKEIDQYAGGGLEYYCASINHASAAEIVVDLRKFSAEVMKSYA
jgi:probable F420-dependent oxidoreductase